MNKPLVGVTALGAAVLVFFLARPPATDVPGTAGTPDQREMPSPGRATRSVRTLDRMRVESRVRPDDLEDLAFRDSQRALAELATLTDPDLRSQSLVAISAGWGKRDPQAVAEWIASLESEEDRLDAALGLVPGWADSAPESCLDWVQSRPPGTLREVAMVELADAWVTRAPEVAFRRFLTLENEGGRERGLHVIVSQWALDAPEIAVASLSQDESPRRDEMLEAALVSLTNQDPELAWKYSDRFADAETVEHVRSMALEAMAEERPQDALRWAATGGNGEVLLAGIARGWALNDEAAATRWIKSLPDRELAARLTKEISE